MIIQFLRKKSVLAGFAAYSVILSLWVNYLLMLYLDLPYFPSFYVTLAGVGAMVLGLAYVVYKGLVSSGMKRRVQSVFPN